MLHYYTYLHTRKIYVYYYYYFFFRFTEAMRGGTGQLHSAVRTTTIFPSRLPTFRHLPRTAAIAGTRGHRRAMRPADGGRVRPFRVTAATRGARRGPAGGHGGGGEGQRRARVQRTRNVFARVFVPATNQFFPL